MKKILGLSLFFVFTSSLALADAVGGTNPPPPPMPICQASTVVSKNNPTVAQLMVSCSQPLGVAVSVYSSDGQLLCDNQRFYADTSESNACTIPRSRTRHLDYRVKINEADNGTLLADSNGTIDKDATYNYPPTGKLVSAQYIKPVSQNKALGRGQYWDASIKAYVVDSDVDQAEGQNLIKVELIEIINGGERVIRTTWSNTNQIVSFDLEHEHILPKVFGKPHESGDLFQGRNTLKVRVWDAYSGPTFVDLPLITIDIQ